ncbi:MAG: O-antigen/teichoic acid export membrane protein [Candidatus Azotimanducaceae bacterium]
MNTADQSTSATDNAGAIEAGGDRQSIGSASALLTVATLVASGANYALNLVLARWMTPSEFGDANLIVTLMLGLTAVAVSLQLIAAQQVSSSTALDQQIARQRLLQRSWIIGGLVALLLAGASPVIATISSSASALPFVLLAVGVPAYLAQSVERGVLQGRLRFRALASTLVVEAAVRLGVAVVLVAAGFGVVGATAGISISFVATWWWSRRCVAAKSVDGVETTTALRMDTRLVSQATMILLVGQIMINNGDVVLAKTLFDADVAGVYSVAALIGRAVFFLSWSVVTAAFPHVARGASAAVVADIRRQAMRHVLLICGSLTVAVALFAPPLTPLVFGAEYSSAGPLFAPYALATSFFAMANLVASLAVAQGRRRPGIVVVLGGIVQTTLLLALVNSPTEMVWLQVMAMAGLFVAVLVADRE